MSSNFSNYKIYSALAGNVICVGMIKYLADKKWKF